MRKKLSAKFKVYLTIALRRLRKNLLTTGLNITGLATGIAWFFIFRCAGAQVRRIIMEILKFLFHSQFKISKRPNN